ncbi:hypothetical protein JCM10512_1294 [Bacteroides reticulotermitis JCM 10512]|uniref:Uncharacterized protein n=1 Tax=Bacteroides reticulotermitis JCM 10512 TaxID=1445607 RepID=W4UR00_9BACE|nr:hypothetical protein JCM10512_1294 [Bacteroides reticulotermitis JCM 10512]
MAAVKSNNKKDTYRATAVAFMIIGALFLIDKLILSHPSDCLGLWIKTTCCYMPPSVSLYLRMTNPWVLSC